ncbi:(2Fe-2S)-binding protein [Prescottella soli]|uniref:(2Fe-2S)-binding protein n=1 Tax=Prescottella soli TaxID=1543852 RepID=A0ABW9FSK0_9NOCA
MIRQPRDCRASSPTAVAETFADLATVGPYFTVTTGEPGPGLWRPTGRLYDDAETLATVVTHVGAQIDTDEQRVAASTLLMGYAARLWSVTLGSIVRGRLLPVLDPEHLLWREDRGRIDLHLRDPRGMEGGDMTALARDMVLDRHLVPLIAAIRAVAPMSDLVLWGDAASALIGSARILDGRTHTTAITAAERILADHRLTHMIEWTDAGHRRRSCCLFYRTPDAGYCSDCVLIPQSADSHPDQLG